MNHSHPPATDDLYARTRFIMVRPSHPGNVGAAARAIKTMGFGSLTLVAPRDADVLQQAEAQALASGATDILASARITDTLAQALAETTEAYALTARPRDLGPPAMDIRQAAAMGTSHLQEQHDACLAFVLGTERAGLSNEDIALCQAICHIPANPAYSSLNVAQALQLAAWELRYAIQAAQGQIALPETGKQSPSQGARPATGEAVQALLAHWEQALVAVDFLDPQHPKKLMPRMRHLFARAQLSKDDADMMRGVCTAMIKSARR